MNDDKMKAFCWFLLSGSKGQVMHILKNITKEQMQIILEIVYNIVHNTLTISAKDRNKMGKYKNLVRKILIPNINWSLRKTLLWKIRSLLPIITKNYISHVKRTDFNTQEKI